MPSLRVNAFCVCLLLALLSANSAHSQGKKSAAKDIDAATVAAYEKLGASHGWLLKGDIFGFGFLPTRENEKKLLPGFCFKTFPKAKLPEVTVPFGLDLQDTKVTDAELKDLAALKNLSWLDLRNTKVTDAGLTELARLKKLTMLAVDGTNVTDASLRTMRESGLLHALCRVYGKGNRPSDRPKSVEEVYHLDLRDTQVTDAGLRELGSLKNLTYIDLTRAKVTDKGLKDLVGFKNLTSLHLFGTMVTEAGLKELAGLKNLTTLQLSHVTDSHLRVLREIGLLHALSDAYGPDEFGMANGRPKSSEDVLRLELVARMLPMRG